ncbi:type II toxin-antitoxin system Phd/YefM family antitoxin [Desulfobacula phenolica]|uniref:Antitoxin n=1 Tax=Desulfobacula phenolica TaxID=90732 RepID=A0A1H2FVI7_9BACT|nr:type II toxin-antitoxin system Phd/YefM family antitoxin [Desulfobacula phenolica]SDU11351.1 prevent-host-death family protein [Desulfobacula phenolica]
MKDFQVSEDILPIAKFKTNASSLLKDLNTSRRSIVITQHGKPVGVVISPKDYDFLVNRNKFLDAISEGLKDSNDKNIVSDEDFKKKLDAEFGKFEI